MRQVFVWLCTLRSCPLQFQRCCKHGQEGGGSSGGVKKRPASKSAAGDDAKKKKNGEFSWLEKDEDEEVEDNGEQDAVATRRPANVLRRPAAAPQNDDEGGERRDRMKHYYFEQGLKRGELSDEVKKAWEGAKGNRKQETELINSVMVKKGGRFVADPYAPGFMEVMSRYEKHWFAKEQKAYPKAVIIGKLGSKRALDEALEDGDVKEVHDEGGRTLYAFCTMKVTEERGKQRHSSTSNGAALDDISLKKVTDQLMNVSFSFNFSPAEQRAFQEKTTIRDLGILVSFEVGHTIIDLSPLGRTKSKQASIQGEGLPDRCIESAKGAQASVQKILKQVVSVLTAMRDHKTNGHIADRIPKMAEMLSELRELEGFLEGIIVMQQGRDKKPITCEQATLRCASCRSLFVL